MKATLNFDLDDPSDILAHNRCIKSLEICIALFRIQRLAIDNETIKSQDIFDITHNLGINLDDLID